MILNLDLVAATNFKIIYFHSLVKGKENRGHIFLKKICSKLTTSMREKLLGIYLVHPNFSINTSLFFY